MAQFFGTGKPIYGSLGYPLFGTAGKPLYSSYMVDIPPPPPPPPPPYDPPEDDPPGPYDPYPDDPPDPYDPYDPYDPVDPDDPHYDPDPPPEDDRRCSVSITVDDPAIGNGEGWAGDGLSEDGCPSACISGQFDGPEDFDSSISGCAGPWRFYGNLVYVKPSDSISWRPHMDLPFKWLSGYNIDIHAHLMITDNDWYERNDIPDYVRARVEATTILGETVTAYVQIPVVHCIFYGDWQPRECDNDAPAPKVATANFHSWSQFADIYQA